MAKNFKYIVAANGTFHLFNNDKQASYCGRVKLGAEGVKLTNLLPKGRALEGLKTCARDTQLSNGLVYGVSNVVRDVAGVGMVAVVTTEAGQTSQEAPESANPAPAKRRGRKAAVTVTEGADDAGTVTVTARPEDVSPYDGIAALLAANEIGSRVNVGPDGARLDFDAAGYTYTVYAPEWNASGPDEGWVISYNDDPSSKDPGYAEPMLSTEQDVIAWLAEDLSLVEPMPKRTRKATPASKGKTGPWVATSGQDTATSNGQDTAKRLVSSHLVTIMSNAQAAIEYAEQYGGIDDKIINGLREMLTAADLMRKDI